MFDTSGALSRPCKLLTQGPGPAQLTLGARCTQTPDSRFCKVYTKQPWPVPRRQGVPGRKSRSRAARAQAPAYTVLCPLAELLSTTTTRAMQQQRRGLALTLSQHVLELLILAAVAHGRRGGGGGIGGDGGVGSGAGGGGGAGFSGSSVGGSSTRAVVIHSCIFLVVFGCGVCCLCIWQRGLGRNRGRPREAPPVAYTPTAAGAAAVAAAKKHWAAFVRSQGAAPASPLPLPPLSGIPARTEPVRSRSCGADWSADLPAK